MKHIFTRVFVLLLLASSLFLLAPYSQAQDVDISISAQSKGLSLEFPLATVSGDYTDSNLLTTIKFAGSASLHISEKTGLTSDTVTESVITTTTPSPVISPREPLITATQSAVVIQEPVAKLIFDSLPTPTPTATPRPTLAPTRVPSPTIVPSAPQPTASSSIQLSSGGLNADKLFDMSNAHRQSIGLPAFQKDDRSCQLAASRAPEINGEVASGTMHSGLRARNLPYWNSENIITMGSEEGAFNWWIHDQIHKEAIEGNYTYSCVACSGNACAQEFTNFQAK
ncbi:hypothetical protein HYS00_00940 [Candidatus Microgenomates bacterium]|nr:hypothetical protein [Candidatus Microgenomates bacterium]